MCVCKSEREEYGEFWPKIPFIHSLIHSFQNIVLIMEFTQSFHQFLPHIQLLQCERLGKQGQGRVGDYSVIGMLGTNVITQNMMY